VNVAKEETRRIHQRAPAFLGRDLKAPEDGSRERLLNRALRRSISHRRAIIVVIRYQLDQKLRELKESCPQLTQAMTVAERSPPQPSYLRVRGDYRT
jgi:hypothetical protein